MRGILLVLLAAALLTHAAPVGAHAAAVAFQANPAHSGDAGDVGLRLPLKRAWTARFIASRYPVAAEGRVFVIRGSRRGDWGPQVAALSIRTGRVLWRRDLGVEVPMSLGYGDGRVVVTRASFLGEHTAVLALDARDGRVLWEQAGSPIDDNPPVVDGGVVYVNALMSTSVSALRLSDGAVLWRAVTDSGHEGAPAVAGDSLFVSMSSCPDVHRLRRTDGAELWHQVDNGCHGGGGSTPALHRGRLYVTESDQLPTDVYDAATGSPLGKVRADLLPAFHGRIGVFPDARRPPDFEVYAHKLVARDLDSGRVRWRFRGDGYLDSPPLIASGIVFVGSGSGRLYGLALRTGRVLWRGFAGAPVPAPGSGGHVGLAAAERTLLVPAGGRLLAYR